MSSTLGAAVTLATTTVDLYVTNKSGKAHWIGNHMQWNWGDTLSFTFRDLETKEGTYELYLPPY